MLGIETSQDVNEEFPEHSVKGKAYPEISP